MTDFLEELLKQQEEDAEEQILFPSSHRATQTAHLWREQFEGRFPDAEMPAVSASTPLARQLFPVDRQAAVASSQEAEPVSVHHDPAAVTAINAAAPPAQPLWVKVKRAYSAARLWQARTVHLSGSSFGTAGQINAPFYGLTKQEPVIPGYAALVDAAFARDARRYDGPLRIL